MRKAIAIALGLAGAVALVLTLGPRPHSGRASSHREAPLISQDPTADNTDTYVFRSPDKPDTATLIANWIPFEDPAGGPNWYTFSPSARYDVYIDKNGDGKPDVAYYFRFANKSPIAFLGNTSQFYNVTKVEDGKATVVGRNLETPPDNIGPRTNGGSYRDIAAGGVHGLSDGAEVFAGQRADAFFGDIGAIFDLVAIRNGTGATGGGRDALAGYNVHAIALQIPISQLDNGGNHVIGVWAATDRPSAAVKGKHATWVQVSRLGNPLVNEALIPTELKDRWNTSQPADDKQYDKYYSEPILAALLNKLYPQFGPFQEKDRKDLVQVLLTGVPGLNAAGTTEADEIRLNLSIPPTTDPSKVSRLGVLGGDLAGYPNGRRLADDVIDISERAVGGALIGHSLPLGDGVDASATPNLAFFPYEPDPYQGFDNSKGVPFPTHS